MIPEYLIPDPRTWQGLLLCFGYIYAISAPVCYLIWKLDRLAREQRMKEFKEEANKMRQEAMNHD